MREADVSKGVRIENNSTMRRRACVAGSRAVHCSQRKRESESMLGRFRLPHICDSSENIVVTIVKVCYSQIVVFMVGFLECQL